ncbi:hypothetical protein J6590_058871 [Homalodisca vitripennis]|nr:hypothetical protein J6590_058871 [Homalodisca vitripennis]
MDMEVAGARPWRRVCCCKTAEKVSDPPDCQLTSFRTYDKRERAHLLDTKVIPSDVTVPSVLYGKSEQFVAIPSDGRGLNIPGVTSLSVTGLRRCTKR